MKLRQYLIYPFIACSVLSACSDDDYTSNDPNAAPGAPAYYDVNDTYQAYSMFYKPSHGWVGDLMPYYENGAFHIFYLQDTRPAPATFHPWYKMTTTNFVDYTDNGEAISTGADNSQEDALGTGDVFKYNNKYYAFYTAHNANLDPKEKIYLATSDNLETWTKQPSFSFQAPDGYDRNEFRDPFIYEKNGQFKMLISTRADVGDGVWKGVIAQFTSADLLSWQVDADEPFLYIDDSEFMLECADFFTIGNYEYLVFSGINSRKVHYKYRPTNSSEWKSPEINSLDGVAFYAAKTAADGTNRYLFGWVPTTINGKDDSAYGWGGSMVVHQLIPNADGTLKAVLNNHIDSNISQLKELKVLNRHNEVQNDNSYTLNADGYVTFDRLTDITKITTTIKTTSASVFGFQFGAAGNEREVCNLEFDTKAGTLAYNRVLKYNNDKAERNVTKLPISDNGEYKVTLVIENSVCAIYVNDKIAFTNRIYLMNRNPWRIYSTDGSAEFYNIKIYK